MEASENDVMTDLTTDFRLSQVSDDISDTRNQIEFVGDSAPAKGNLISVTVEAIIKDRQHQADTYTITVFDSATYSMSYDMTKI